MNTFKQSAIAYVPVCIVDDAGAGITGIAYNSALLTGITVAKSGAAAASKTLAVGDWVEAGAGWYWVKLSTSETDTVGPGILHLVYNGDAGDYVFQVRTNTEAEVIAALPGAVDVNTVRDQVVYDGTDITDARLRVYDTAANATAAGATGLLRTYNIVATYSAPGVLATYTVTLV